MFWFPFSYTENQDVAFDDSLVLEDDVYDSQRAGDFEQSDDYTVHDDAGLDEQEIQEEIYDDALSDGQNEYNEYEEEQSDEYDDQEDQVIEDRDEQEVDDSTVQSSGYSVEEWLEQQRALNRQLSSFPHIRTRAQSVIAALLQKISTEEKFFTSMPPVLGDIIRQLGVDKEKLPAIVGHVLAPVVGPLYATRGILWSELVAPNTILSDQDIAHLTDIDLTDELDEYEEESLFEQQEEDQAIADLQDSDDDATQEESDIFHDEQEEFDDVQDEVDDKEEFEDQIIENDGSEDENFDLYQQDPFIHVEDDQEDTEQSPSDDDSWDSDNDTHQADMVFQAQAELVEEDEEDDELENQPVSQEQKNQSDDIVVDLDNFGNQENHNDNNFMTGIENKELSEQDNEYDEVEQSAPDDEVSQEEHEHLEARSDQKNDVSTVHIDQELSDSEITVDFDQDSSEKGERDNDPIPLVQDDPEQNDARNQDTAEEQDNTAYDDSEITVDFDQDSSEEQEEDKAVWASDVNDQDDVVNNGHDQLDYQTEGRDKTPQEDNQLDELTVDFSES